LNSPPSAPETVEIRAEKTFGAFTLSVDLALSGSGVTVIFGPSGAGKTTLLNLLAGLVQPDRGLIRFRGRVFFDSERGRRLPPEKRRLSYVFQQPRLFSHFSVLGNLLFAASFCGRRPAPGAFEKTTALLGLEKLLDRRPNTLSGGESQRVALGRALLASSEMLLMDEPLSSLDRARKDELVDLVARIPKEFGVPVLYVTHAEDELLALADEVLEMRDGRGRLTGPPAGPRPVRRPTGAWGADSPTVGPADAKTASSVEP
jgi:molybdate transport system ATP-binding protein